MASKNNDTVKRKYLFNYPDSFKDEYEIYSSALQEAIEREGVRNIGIVAPYGSGKSSLVKTFFSNRPKLEKKTNYISLATFNQKDINPNLDMNKVEKSILEQIIFKRKHHWSSRSRIDRIRGKIIPSILLSLFSVALIALILVALMEYLGTLPFSSGKNFYWYFGSAIVAGLLFVFTLFHELKIRKLCVSNIEIEFDKDKNGSVLNQFIDEIINYCDETKRNVFVFEDIDRFGCVDLLLKLREINFLLNENEKIINARLKIVFIYCVKDDIFILPEDRAKFFDFVVSLTPVLNPGNARMFIQKAIKDNDDNNLNLPDSSLAEMSSFIKEKRILNNIFNDYLFYKDSLKIEKKENEKLFAMMIYKNLSSSDFTKLQSNSGILYELFNERKIEAIEEAIASLSEQINKAKEKLETDAIADAKKEMEIYRQRIAGIIARRGASSQTLRQGYFDIYSLTTFKQDFVGAYISARFQDRYGGYSNCFVMLDKDAIARELNVESLSVLEDSIINNSRSSINKKIMRLNSELATVRRKSVQSLLLSNYYNPGFVEKIKKDAYLYFAVKNMYIDESYFKFTGRPDIELDNEYINNVLNNEAIDPKRVVQNPSLVISKLSKNRICTPSAFNVFLVDALLCKENNAYQDKRKAFFAYLAKEDVATKIAFICDYIEEGNELDSFVLELYNNNYADLVTDVSNKAGVSSDITTRLVKQIIELGLKNKEIINSFNEGGAVRYCLERSEHLVEAFLSLFDTSVSFIKFLKEYEINNITCLDDFTVISEKHMFDAFKLIINNKLYEVNAHNVQIIGKAYLKKDCLNVSAFLQDKNDSLRDYCFLHLDKLVSSVTLCCESIIDEELIIEEILKSEEVEDGTKEQYLSKLITKINYKEDYSDFVISLLIINELLKPAYSNIAPIVANNKVGEEAIAPYINDYITLFKDTLTNNAVFISLVNNKKINEQHIDKIIVDFESKIDISTISIDCRRQKILKHRKAIIDFNALSACKNDMNCIVEIISQSPDLIHELQNVFEQASEYISLMKNGLLKDEFKSVVLATYWEKFVSDLNSEDAEYALHLLIENRQQNFDAGLLSYFAKHPKCAGFKNQIIEIASETLDDKNLIDFVSNCDPDLMNKLTVSGDKATIKISDLDNEYYKILENRGIVMHVNSRKVHCNVFISKLKKILGK